MAQGRSSTAAGTAMVGITLLGLMLHCEIVHAATYTVGGSLGWTFDVTHWPKGKYFRAGDTLIFNYDPSSHNVVAVDRNGYINCQTTPGAKVYRSGSDQITLAKGKNYFICNFPGHCESKTKIAINAM